MNITTEQFKSLFPRATEPEAWAAALSAIMPRYGINTSLRIAAFLAQCGHESAGFTRLAENLNYSAQALADTWPNRYAINPKAKMKEPNKLALRLQRNPEAIGNNVYADRMGNGPEESGDGWRYRGRGLIQLTGKDNYAAFARAVGAALEDVCANLETKTWAVESACWYWSTRGLNALADARDIIAITKRINGGTNGIDDRQARYAQALTTFTA